MFYVHHTIKKNEITNNIRIGLLAYPLKTYVDGSLNPINNTLNTKPNTTTVSTPLIKDISNNIIILLSNYVSNSSFSILNASNVSLGTFWDIYQIHLSQF